jgi:glutathione S-transferase
MLTLHHLNDSRSQRILWLFEEIGVPYDIEKYQRNAQTRLAPPELKSVHALGKSPVITDGDLTIAESGAIVDYVIRRYGKGAMMPEIGSRDYEVYNEWMHYAEGSAMLPLLLHLYVGRLKEAGSPLHPRIDSELAQSSRSCRSCASRPRVLHRLRAHGRRHPDELCRRDGEGVRQARPVSKPLSLALAHACAPGLPALGREGRGVPVCDLGWYKRPGIGGGTVGNPPSPSLACHHILHKYLA